MFQGDFSFDGAPLTQNILMITSFMTIVLLLAQERDIVIPILDIIQSLICWPTLYEGIILSSSLWAFRYIERILGTRILVNFLIYNAATFVPLYLVIIFFAGFHSHFPFLYFIPFGLFIFILWNMPAMKISGSLYDKALVTLMFIVVLIISFPYSLAPLFAAILGNILFAYDVLRLKRCVKVEEDVSELGNHNHETNDDIDINVENQMDNNDNTTDEIEQSVQSMIEMGFTEEESRSALRRANGNMENAIGSLLESR